jgi:hypothetical protein
MRALHCTYPLFLCKGTGLDRAWPIQPWYNDTKAIFHTIIYYGTEILPRTWVRGSTHKGYSVTQSWARQRIKEVKEVKHSSTSCDLSLQYISMSWNLLDQTWTSVFQNRVRERIKECKEVKLISSASVISHLLRWYSHLQSGTSIKNITPVMIDLDIRTVPI